jgi:hypothetical protein
VRSRSELKRSALSCQKKQTSDKSKGTKCDKGIFTQDLTQETKKGNDSSLKSFKNQSNVVDNKQELSSKTEKEEANKMEEETENVKGLASPTGNDIDTCASECDCSGPSTDTSTQSQSQESCRDEQLVEM